MLVVGFASRVRACTVTGMLQAAGLAGCWHHSRAHDFFARSRWDPDELGLRLLGLSSDDWDLVRRAVYRQAGKPLRGVRRLRAETPRRVPRSVGLRGPAACPAAGADDRFVPGLPRVQAHGPCERCRPRRPRSAAPGAGQRVERQPGRAIRRARVRGLAAAQPARMAAGHLRAGRLRRRPGRFPSPMPRAASRSARSANRKRSTCCATPAPSTNTWATGSRPAVGTVWDVSRAVGRPRTFRGFDSLFVLPRRGRVDKRQVAARAERWLRASAGRRGSRVAAGW